MLFFLGIRHAFFFGEQTLSIKLVSIISKVILSNSFTSFQTETFPSQFLSIPLRSYVTTKLVPPVLSKTTLFHIIYFNLQFVCNFALFKGINCAIGEIFF